MSKVQAVPINPPMNRVKNTALSSMIYLPEAALSAQAFNLVGKLLIIADVEGFHIGKATVDFAEA